MNKHENYIRMLGGISAELDYLFKEVFTVDKSELEPEQKPESKSYHDNYLERMGIDDE